MSLEYYYFLSYLFVGFSVFLLITTILYGIKYQILTKILKYYGIEKRREVKRMRKINYNSSNDETNILPSNFIRNFENQTTKLASTIKLDCNEETNNEETVLLKTYKNSKFVKKKEIIVSGSAE